MPNLTRNHDDAGETSSRLAELQLQQQYKLLPHRMGQGAYATTFLAFPRPWLHRPRASAPDQLPSLRSGLVVIKRIDPSVVDLDAGVDREVWVAGKIPTHRNVNALVAWGTGTEDGSGPSYWQAYPLCNGGSLLSLRSQGPVPEWLIMQILIETLRALEHLHGHQIYHNDIHADNIMLHFGQGEERPTVKLIDFGRASYFETSSAEDDKRRARFDLRQLSKCMRSLVLLQHSRSHDVDCSSTRCGHWPAHISHQGRRVIQLLISKTRASETLQEIMEDVVPVASDICGELYEALDAETRASWIARRVPEEEELQRMLSSRHSESPHARNRAAGVSVWRRIIRIFRR